MSYKLGKHSMTELIGVHPSLKNVVELAITYTTQDFRVFDGLRTEAEQRKNIIRGVSKTTKSYHLYGLAVDLVPVINGKMVFEVKNNQKATLALYKPIAEAIKKASKELGVDIDWGFDLWGWDMPHFQITKLKGKDARLVYDFRKGGYYA